MAVSLGVFPFGVNRHDAKSPINMRDIIAKNIQTLMDSRGMTADAMLGEAAGIDQKTIWRIRRMEQSTNVDKLQAIAEVFGLQAWQMLIPDLDPARPPVLIPRDRRARKENS